MATDEKDEKICFSCKSNDTTSYFVLRSIYVKCWSCGLQRYSPKLSEHFDQLHQKYLKEVELQKKTEPYEL